MGVKPSIEGSHERDECEPISESSLSLITSFHTTTNFSYGRGSTVFGAYVSDMFLLSIVKGKGYKPYFFYFQFLHNYEEFYKEAMNVSVD